MWLSLNGKSQQIFIVSIFCAVVFLSGCASLGTYNAATQRSEFIIVPTSQEVAMGQQSHDKLKKEYTFSNDAKYINRLNKIAQKVSLVSDRQDYQYQFFAVDKDELNAFTTPGGFVYVFTGLMDKMNDDQLAFVIAHEVGHCAAKHTIKKYQAALGYNLLGSLIIGQLGVETQQLAQLSTGAIMNLAFSAYSRQDEYEADRLGVKYMKLAGFNTNGASESLDVLLQASKGPKVPVILMSHPHLEDRIKSVKFYIQNSR